MLHFCFNLPAGGTDEREGDELVPERVILRYGLSAYQGLEVGVFRQVSDLAGVGSHLYWLHSARLAALFTWHMPNPVVVGEREREVQGSKAS